MTSIEGVLRIKDSDDLGGPSTSLERLIASDLKTLTNYKTNSHNLANDYVPSAIPPNTTTKAIVVECYNSGGRSIKPTVMCRETINKVGSRNAAAYSTLQEETTAKCTVITERNGTEISIPRTHHKIPSFSFSNY